MITTQQLLNEFEADLNALLDYENLNFKLWADAGERKKAFRQGNDVYTYITGNVRVSASSITANRLVMGVNNLTITVDIPVDPPKTTAQQAAGDLARVKNGQYWFVQYITGILTGYFQRYQAFEMQDEKGVNYGVGLVAGVAIPQDINLDAWLDDHIPVNIYIEANVVQGGIISLNIAVELDGEPVPFQSFVPDRTGVLDPSVYSGSEVSKVVVTSSAFAAEISIPTNTVYNITGNAVAASTTIQSGEIREVYDFGTYYMLVLNGISGYSVIRIGSDLKHISTVTVSDRHPLAIRPVVTDGVQKFLVAEKNATGVDIVRYGADFSAAEADRVGVGLADSADVFMNGESVFVLLHATTDRLYVIDSGLNFTASSTTLLQGMTAFHDCATYSGGFLVLYSAGDALTLADIRNDGTSMTRSISVGTQKAFILRTAEGTSAVVCAVENGVKIIGL